MKLKLFSIDSPCFAACQPIRFQQRAAFVQQKVQYTDMDSFLRIQVCLTSMQGIKCSAQILQWPLRPVMIVDNLHLHINLGTVIKLYPDIKNIFLFINGFPQHDRIADPDAADLLLWFMKQCTDQTFKCIFIFLVHCFEQIIVRHRDWQLSGFPHPSCLVIVDFCRIHHSDTLLLNSMCGRFYIRPPFSFFIKERYPDKVRSLLA